MDEMLLYLLRVVTYKAHHRAVGITPKLRVQMGQFTTLRLPSIDLSTLGDGSMFDFLLFLYRAICFYTTLACFFVYFIALLPCLCPLLFICFLFICIVLYSFLPLS